jgi:hypothetical protein
MTKTQRHIIDHKQQTALRPLMLFYVLVCLFVSVGSAQVISTSGSVSINNTSGTVIGTTTIETAAGADVTNNGTINLSGDWTNGGTYTSASGTVEYLGAGAQSVAGLNYHHLLLSTSGTKTLAASTAVAGNLTLSGTAAVVDNGFQITGNGSGTMTLAAGNTLTLGTAGTATLFPTNFTNGNTTLSAGSTVIYNSDQAQTISGTPTYSHLTLTATSAVTKTVDAALTVNGDLTVNANNTLERRRIPDHGKCRRHTHSCGRNNAHSRHRRKRDRLPDNIHHCEYLSERFEYGRVQLRSCSGHLGRSRLRQSHVNGNIVRHQDHQQRSDGRNGPDRRHQQHIDHHRCRLCTDQHRKFDPERFAR